MYSDKEFVSEILECVKHEETLKNERTEIAKLLGLKKLYGSVDFLDKGKLQNYRDNNVRIETVYCDRMWQWDMDKYNKCCKKIWNNIGQFFKERCKHPENIQNFLSLYFEKECELLAVITETNQSNGYPISCFFYACKE